MKIAKLLINLLGISLITAGLIYYFQSYNTLSNAATTQTNTSETNVTYDEEGQNSNPITNPSEKRDPNRLWCKEHGVYEDECSICHPELAKAQEQQESCCPPNATEGDPNRLWCKEHGVYEDECTICHPELAKGKDSKGATEEQRDPKRLWCKEHGVYEDECSICHPELAKATVHGSVEIAPNAQNRDPNRLWCKEHGVYEDQCVICHPELADQTNDSSLPLFCKTHQVTERECGICQPQLAKEMKPGESMKVRFPSAQSYLKAGVRTGKPRVGEARQIHTFPAEVVYNQNHFANITPLTEGVVQQVYVDLGDSVKKGDVLLEIASTKIAQAKSDYLNALAQENLKRMTYQREQELFEKKISAEQEYQQAEAEYQMAKTAVRTARQQLINYGLTETEIESVKQTESSSAALKIRAPFDGVIIGKHAVLGENAKPGAAVFELANLSDFWLQLSIPESQIAQVSVGDAIHAQFESLPGFEAPGEITWISSQLDDQSRMLKARAVIENTQGLLKKGLYGKARLQKEETHPVLLAPIDSVQQVDNRPYVFVKQSDDLFDLRAVEVSGKRDQTVKIAQGLSPEDEIVIDGAFVLKSELLRSRFGAGCAHD